MPKSARRYDIYLPLTFNDGRPVDDYKFQGVEARLLGRFGGVTAQQHDFPFRGIWRNESQIYVDQVVVMTVLDFRSRGSTAFIAALKRHLVREFEQLEILITETSLQVH